MARQREYGMQQKKSILFHNSPNLFSVESVLHYPRQGNLTVTQQFNNLARNWKQLVMFEDYNWNCQEDGIKY